MDEDELLRYMSVHSVTGNGKGEAKVGQTRSVESARSLLEKGLIVKIGALEGNDVFRMTDKGWLKIGKKKESNWKKALHVAQDYATAMKQEHPFNLSGELKEIDKLRPDEDG